MAKPRKIVLVSDDQKRFGAEVFDLIRTKLALAVGGNINLGVKLAADYFAPRKPGEVTAVELGDAIPQIVAKFEADSAAEAASNHDRLPFEDEMQKDWDSGLYKGQVTVRGLFERFAAEIKDDVEISKSMFKAYLGELAVEKARVAELLNEQPDPGSVPVDCVFAAHRGDDRKFQPTFVHKLFRNDVGQLERQKHSQGGEFILVGNFLVLKDEETGQVTGETAAYCSPCRDAAREMARNAEPSIKITFYTTAGAKRVVAAAKSRVEIDAAAMRQIQSAGARTFGGRGAGKTSKVDSDWRTTRRSHAGKK